MNLVEYQTINRVAYISLNRPDKRNALNPELVQALKHTFEKANTDHQAKVIVLKARGEAFSAGADLAHLQQLQTNALSFFIPGKDAISCPDVLTWEQNFDAMSEQLVNSSLPTEDKVAKLKALVEVNLPTLDRLPVDKKVLYIGRQATRINRTKG